MKLKRNDPCICGSGIKYKNCCHPYSAKFMIYADETGNSGSNYIDKNQPFYIVGGWIVPLKHVNNTQILKELRDKVQVTGELKGTKLTANKRNQKHITDFFKELRKMGFKQTLVFVEKRYAIAAKVIETFLDPVYNPKVTNRYTYDNVLKKELAEKVYLLPESILESFANAYRLLDYNIMENALNELCNGLRDIKEFRLANLLDGAFEKLQENVETEKSTHIEFLPNNAAASLNIPAFISFFTKVEEYGRYYNYQLSIIHDETRVYEPGYKKVYNMFSNAPLTQFQLTDGANILLGTTHLHEVLFENSKEDNWIQAADLLLSGINRFLKAIYNNEPITTELLELGKFIHPAVLDDGYRIGESVCSKNLRKKIIQMIQ